VAGCSKVNPHLALSNNCVECNSTEFYPIPNSDGCLIGRKVGDHCTNMIGCLSLAYKSGGLVCLNCDLNDRYNLINGECTCLDYYGQVGVRCV